MSFRRLFCSLRTSALGCVFVAACGVRASDDLPLPSWSEEEIRAQINGNLPPLLGGALLPDGMIAEDSVPRVLLRPPSIGDPAQASPSAPEDVSLFLPDALLGAGKNEHHDPQLPTPASALRDLDGEFFEACVEAPVDTRLLDPASLVSETQREDITRFLEFHARDARIDAYVLVIDRDQRLAEGVDLSRVASGALVGKKACLAVYPLGEPWRVRLFMSSEVHDTVAPGYLAGLLEDCSRDAMQAGDSLEQLHRFTVRLSIRLFWLEKVLPKEGGVSARPQAQKTATNPLPEILPAERVTAAVAEASRSWLQRVHPAWWGALTGLVIAVPAGMAWRARRKQFLRTHVWRLPEREVPSRLGGAFSGGAGVSVQFRG